MKPAFARLSLIDLLCIGVAPRWALVFSSSQGMYYLLQVAAGVVSVANCSSYVFCNEWLCLCAQFHAVLESLVADCIGMAA